MRTQSNKDPDQYVIEKIVDDRQRKKRVEYLVKVPSSMIQKNKKEGRMIKRMLSMLTKEAIKTQISTSLRKLLMTDSVKNA
jgi:hypothetical protein